MKNIKRKYVIIAVFGIVLLCVFGLVRIKMRKAESIVEEAKNHSWVRELTGREEKIKTVKVQKHVPVENRVATYNILAEIDSEMLEGYQAEVFYEGEQCTWYKVKERKGIQYLICEVAGGNLSLWEFDSIEIAPSAAVKAAYPEASYSGYTYKEVLELIHHVTDAEDISYIVAYEQPFEWIWDAKEITDASDIERFYEVLSGLVYVGEEDSGQWDNEADLVVVLRDDTTIINLEYNAEIGRFVEENETYNADAATRVRYKFIFGEEYEDMNRILDLK